VLWIFLSVISYCIMTDHITYTYYITYSQAMLIGNVNSYIMTYSYISIHYWYRYTAVQDVLISLTAACCRTRLSIGNRSFRVTVTCLPTNVTASTSLPSFKRQLKTFYLPNLSHYFKSLSLICVQCPRSYFISR